VAITVETLQEFAQVLQGASSLRDAVTCWRAHDAATRMVIVDVMDMRDEAPALQVGQRQVYLATSSGHCWSITQHCHEATALILTQS
jgi:hypothetical protein